MTPELLEQAATQAAGHVRTLNRLNAMRPAMCRTLSRMLLAKLRTAPTVRDAAALLVAWSNFAVAILGEQFRPDLQGMRELAATIPGRLELTRGLRA